MVKVKTKAVIVKLLRKPKYEEMVINELAIEKRKTQKMDITVYILEEGRLKVVERKVVVNESMWYS